MLFSVRPEATVLAILWENPSLVDSLTYRKLALTQVIKDLFWKLHESFRIFFLNCLRFTYINIVFWPLVTEFEIQKDLCDSFVQAARQSLVSVELSACQHSCPLFIPSCSAKSLVWGSINACGKFGTWVEWDSCFSLLLHVWEKEPSHSICWRDSPICSWVAYSNVHNWGFSLAFSSTGYIFIHCAFVISVCCLFKDLKPMPNFFPRL